MGLKLATAEWADPEAVARKQRYEPGRFWLGRSPAADRSPLGHTDDRHICLVCGSRGGKGTTSIINNLCLWPGSIIAIDPKGENATVTAARRGRGSQHCKGLGQEVRVLDPFSQANIDPALRARFNPLDALDPASPRSITEASGIANALVVMNDPKERFWDDKAREIIRGVILHVLTYPHFEGERTLMTVRALIRRGHWKAVEALQAAGETVTDSPHRLLWKSVARNKSFSVLAELGDSMLNLEKSDAKLHAGFLETAAGHLSFLDEVEMQHCLAASDFRLSDLKTSQKGVSVFLCLPSRLMDSHYRWLRMMMALTLSEMEKTKGQPASGHPVLMVLDEFAGLKKMEVVENAAAQIAGYGVKMFFVLQSLAQFKAIYGDNWETFLGNCGLKLFFNLEDEFSAEYVSKFIGETEIIRETQSQSASESESQSTSRGKSTSTTRGESNSVSDGTSSSLGTSQSDGTSRNTGGNSSRSDSVGTSRSHSWKLDPLFFRNTSRFFSLFRTDESTSEGVSAGRSDSEGTSWGKSDSSTQGTSETLGTSQSRTRGTSTSETIGESTSETQGTSQSSTKGTNETIQKRRLITPDEIRLHFGRVNDPKDPRFPGLGLALISGERPAVIHRINYYEEPLVEGLFNPHPEHGLPAKTTRQIEAESQSQYLNYELKNKTDGDFSCLIEAGEHVIYDCPVEGFFRYRTFLGKVLKPIGALLGKECYKYIQHDRLILTDRRFIIACSDVEKSKPFRGVFVIHSIPYKCARKINVTENQDPLGDPSATALYMIVRRDYRSDADEAHVLATNTGENISDVVAQIQALVRRGAFREDLVFDLSKFKGRSA